MSVPKQHIDSAWMPAAGTEIHFRFIRSAASTRHVDRARYRVSGTRRIVAKYIRVTRIGPLTVFVDGPA
jgi:hypothetical protein